MSGHGAGHAYQITTLDDQNSIFKGLPKIWMHVNDELYHGQRGPAENMHILATAFSSPESKGTGVSDADGLVDPIWQRQSYHPCARPSRRESEHPTPYDCVGFRTVLQRSVEWVATDKVSIPVPKNFPTAEKVSVIPE